MGHAGGITRRSIIVALGLVPLLCAFTQWGDYVVNASLMAGSFPPLAAFFLFVVLVLAVNTAVFLVRPRAAFSRAELLFVYCVLGVVSGIPARGLIHFLLPNITAHRYYATPANHWEELLAGHIPAWVAPQDPEVVRTLYEGLRPGSAMPWEAWAGPLLGWVTLYGALYVAVICACALVSRQWIDHERLLFPLVDIPLALTETGRRSPVPTLTARFFRDRLVWLGALGPIIVHSLESMHYYYPAIPAPRLRDIPLDPIFAQHPLRAMRPFSLCLYPSVIGLTFLLPAQMSLSFWFFYVLTKLQRLVGAMTGLLGTGTPPLSSFPYLEQQGGGAYLAAFALFLWTGRRHFRAMLRGEEAPGSSQVLAPKLAIGGLLLSFAAVVLWSHFANLTATFGLGFFAVYLIYNVVLMRLVAEGGLFWPLGPLQPDHLIFTVTGTRSIGANAITNAALQMQHVREYRCMVGPSVLQAIKLRPEMEDRSRALLPILLGAIALMIAIAVPCGLAYSYRLGGLSLVGLGGVGWCFTGFAREPFLKAAARLNTPVGPDWRGIEAAAIGALVTVAIAALRFRFTWWPFHPLGYVLAGTIQFYLYDQMWFSIFLAWFLKVLVARYGAGRGFRAGRRIAIGLIFGEMMTAGVWALIHALTGAKGLRLMAP